MARRPEVVVDSSVACKWFLPEPDREAALLLRQAHVDGQLQLVAPDLLVYEVANVLRFRPGFTESSLRRDLGDLLDLQLGLLPVVKQNLVAAGALALDRGLTVYDACYVHLAERRSCPLVTCDGKMLSSCSRAAPLSAWRPPG